MRALKRAQPTAISEMLRGRATFDGKYFEAKGKLDARPFLGTFQQA